MDALRKTRPSRALPPRMDIYDFIVAYKREHGGDSPTRREMMEAMDITSLSMISHYLIRLEREGLIRLARDKNGKRTARTIQVVGAQWLGPEEVTGEELRRTRPRGRD